MIARTLAVLVLGAAAAAPTSGARAWTMQGHKSVILHTREGTDIPIGSVDFTPDGKATRYALTIDEGKFKEFFLSMREFKCLQGTEIQCIVPYPYKHPHVVRDGDLSWLEHDLLFFFKAPNDYGAKMQNGLIYHLKPTDHGLVGTPQAIDLEKIASPPANPDAPPYGAADRDDISAGARWIESLRIE